jgi:lambda family phage portal protein
VGQLLDRAIDNVLGTGLHLQPMTGDPGLDREQLDYWEAWSSSFQADWARRQDWSGLERLALRHRFLDGDCFAILHQTGGGDIQSEFPLAVQVLEGDRVSAPDTVSDDNVHGVEIDYLTDRVLGYHFTVPRRGQRKRHTLGGLWYDTVFYPAHEETGEPAVLHVYEPSRLTQSRGVTAFHAVFDICGMFEDLNFAKLVQQQVVSCIAVFVQTERDYRWGNRETENRKDGTADTFEELYPGLVTRLRPGEKVESFSPRVPNAEYFEHVRLILRMIGMSLGMPLELVLLDTTDTTFHGYRGALQQAQKGFVGTQVRYPKRFGSPVWRRLLQLWNNQAAAGNSKQYRHKWRGEGWPYVDPKTDAEAERVRLRSGLASPRQIQQERGRSWDDVKAEMVEDYASAIELAVERVQKLKEQYPEETFDLTWRDVVSVDQGSIKQTKTQHASINPESGQPTPSGDPRPQVEEGDTEEAGEVGVG